MPISKCIKTTEEKNACPNRIYPKTRKPSASFLRSIFAGSSGVALSGQAATLFPQLQSQTGHGAAAAARQAAVPATAAATAKTALTPLLESSGCKLPLIYMYLFLQT